MFHERKDVKWHLMVVSPRPPGGKRRCPKTGKMVLEPDPVSLFQHTIEGDDDMPAHIRTALTAVNLSIPFKNGQLALGTWQGIYLYEHRLASHPAASSPISLANKLNVAKTIFK